MTTLDKVFAGLWFLAWIAGIAAERIDLFMIVAIPSWLAYGVYLWWRNPRQKSLNWYGEVRGIRRGTFGMPVHDRLQVGRSVMHDGSAWVEFSYTSFGRHARSAYHPEDAEALADLLERAIRMQREAI